MTINFDETTFINNIVNYYLNNNYYYDKNIIININNNYSLIFDIFFIKMTKTNNCKVLLKKYCTIEEIKDAKYRFKENYVELKLSLILYHKFINALINRKNEYFF